MKKGFTIWCTGLSGAGKSTVAGLVTEKLRKMGKPLELLDGDEVRTHLSKGLGFSKQGRDTNIHRLGYVAKLLNDNGLIVIIAAISPYREIRDSNRKLIKRFVEVHVQCPLSECERRDVKGLYQKARAGEIENFTGISDPYETPENPEVVLNTDQENPDESAEKVLDRCRELGYL